MKSVLSTIAVGLAIVAFLFLIGIATDTPIVFMALGNPVACETANMKGPQKIESETCQKVLAGKYEVEQVSPKWKP